MADVNNCYLRTVIIFLLANSNDKCQFTESLKENASLSNALYNTAGS